jgi:hypothetical protein
MRVSMRLAVDGCLLAMAACLTIALHVSLVNICRANLSHASAFQHYGSTDVRAGRRNRDRS